MSLTDNAASVYFASSLQIDKIIGTFSGSFALNSSGVAGVNNTASTPISTGIDETTFFYGIFSVDSGVTWNPIGVNRRHVESDDVTVNPQGEYVVLGQSEIDVFTLNSTNTASASATQFFNYTVLYKVALVAKPDQGDITIQSIGTNVFFDSRLNYQKIVFDEKVSSSGSNQTVITTHNLGYVPKLVAFAETGGVLKDMGSSVYSINSLLIGSTTTTATVRVAGSFTGSVYTRIYYDA